MMKQLSGFISRIVILMAIIVTPAFAQQADSVQVQGTKKRMPFTSSVAPYFDYGKAMMMWTSQETKYEFGVQVDFFNKLFLVTEFGYGELVPPDSYTNAGYTSSGNYYRFGVGYKIEKDQKFNFGISGRYARSSFSDQGTVEIISNTGIYDNFSQDFQRSDLSATWYEVVFHSEQRIWKGLYLGMIMRLRIMDKYDKQAPLDVYSIPGYGRTFDKTVPALNLYVKYAFENFEYPIR